VSKFDRRVTRVDSSGITIAKSNKFFEQDSGGTSYVENRRVPWGPLEELFNNISTRNKPRMFFFDHVVLLFVELIHT
jgi:hypothetical protein